MSTPTFQYYLDRYTLGTITQEEWEIFRRLLKEEQNVEMLDHYMDEQLKDAAALSWQYPTINKEVMEGVLIKINGEQGMGDSRTVHRIHFLKRTWFKYAAAIIIMLTGAAIWYAQHIHSKSFNPLNHSSRQIASIASNHDRAILTLANGQQILLDSAQGNIVNQGGLTVINLAGKLKYEGVGAIAEYNTIATPKGGQYQIVLPDGSRVWLNAASSIKFPTAFTGAVRQVEVTGEVYMEIMKNTKQPFIVKQPRAEIQVLGTSFNVNAYSDEEVLKTTLVDGSIKIKAADKELFLKPGQQAIINHANQNTDNVKNPLIQVQTANINNAIAWKNGEFSFEHADIRSIMRQLSRWYNVEVEYKGTLSGGFYAHISRNQPVNKVLQLLALTGELSFEIHENKIIVKDTKH